MDQTLVLVEVPSSQSRSTSKEGRPWNIPQNTSAVRCVSSSHDKCSFRTLTREPGRNNDMCGGVQDTCVVGSIHGAADIEIGMVHGQCMMQVGKRDRPGVEKADGIVMTDLPSFLRLVVRLHYPSHSISISSSDWGYKDRIRRRRFSQPNPNIRSQCFAVVRVLSA